MAALTPSTPLTAPAPAPAPSALLVLFARAVIATLDLWPALTIAVREEWGGPDSAAKKTWIASVLIDEFESRAGASPSPAEDALPLDQDEVADLLQQIMSDEFDANVEDGSLDAVAGDIVRAWKACFAEGAEGAVSELEERAGRLGRGVKATQGKGPEVDSDDEEGSGSENGSEDGMDVDGDEAPQLVPASQERERVEKVVDDDGFELVQKKGRR